MKIRNSIKRGLLVATVVGGVGFSACTDDIAFGDEFVDAQPSGMVTIDTIFNSATYVEQFLTGIYATQYYGLTYGNNGQVGNGSEWLYNGKYDSFTDLYSQHWASSSLYYSYYQGSLTANSGYTLFNYTDDEVWESVRACNIMLNKLEGDNAVDVPELTDEDRERIIAETRCLKAARYFDAFLMYGGLPLIDNVYTGDETTFYIPRATLDSTVNYMVDLLDAAIESNSLQWAFFSGNTSSTNTSNIGRWTKAGAMALKAKILTYAASPLYNNDVAPCGGSSLAEQQNLVWYGNYDASRWTRALQACEDFYNELQAQGQYKLVEISDLGLDASNAAYRLAYRRAYLMQASTEVIHSTRVRDYDNWANGYYNWSNWVHLGRLSHCPTFEYMCMYPWEDGSYFDWDEDHNKIFGTKRQNYANAQLFYDYRNGKSATRDPRMYENMIVNGMTAALDWNSAAESGDEYELWVGGVHAGEDVLKETLVTCYPTGFGVMKYDLGPLGANYQRQPLQWVYLSLDEFYLHYAECLAQTGNLEKANEFVNIVRARVGLNSLAAGSRWGTQVRTDKDIFLAELLRERACELGMSNARYHDMCRYKMTRLLTDPLHGLLVYRIQVSDKVDENGDYIISDILKPYIGDEKNAGNPHPTLFRYEVFTLNKPEGGRYLWKYHVNRIDDVDPDSDEYEELKNEDMVGFNDEANLANSDVTKWFFSPFPQNEELKGYGLVNNPGWGQE